jgi:TonB family protein
MTAIFTLALFIPLFIPTTGPEAVPTILQQVRIGNAPLIPNTGMTPPIALVHPRPRYTTEAIAAGVSGTVTVRAEFDIDGNFQVLEVIDSPGFGLEEAALAALQTWTFRPAYRSGRRVAVVANLDIAFQAPTVRRDFTGGVSGIGGSFLGVQYDVTPPAGSPPD